MPLPTPRLGSSTCSSKTRQHRSTLQEQVLHALSSSTGSSSQQQAKDKQAQLTSLIKGNSNIVTSAAHDAGLPILHKLSGTYMYGVEYVYVL